VETVLCDAHVLMELDDDLVFLQFFILDRRE
jgi:hypothetical protein